VSPDLRVHSYAVTPDKGTLVLLCSDGLHGVVEEGEIEKTLAGNGNLESKCKRLVKAARDAGGPDNITAVLLEAT